MRGGRRQAGRVAWALALAGLLLGCAPPSSPPRREAAGKPARAVTATPRRFGDYPIAPADLFDGRPAAVDLESHPEARAWRTLLREGASRGPDFAGHWTVILLGCGPECQRVALVDARNGRVWLAPWVANLGVAHRLESRLLVVNPAAEARAAVEHGGAPERYVTRRYEWTGAELALLDSVTYAPPDTTAR